MGDVGGMHLVAERDVVKTSEEVYACGTPKFCVFACFCKTLLIYDIYVA